MNDCYATAVEFRDPAFGTLQGNEVSSMWQMLLKNTGIVITSKNIRANDTEGSADWTAVYTFSRTGRQVTNHVHARFLFSNGKITRHHDHFSFWKWAAQALGMPGYLLGWTSFLRKKLNRQANASLQKFMAGQQSHP